MIMAGLPLLASASSHAAEPVMHEGFDRPDLTVWKLSDGDRTSRILAHDCVTNEARQGSGSERLVVAAPAGESVHWHVPCGRLPVLDELEVRLWVRSTGPAVRLAARIVLPRSVDEVTHAQRTVLVRSEPSDRGGNWQQLQISGVPRLLANEVRVLRATPGSAIDPGEAYVDAIVLIVPGEPTGTTVWTDELEVDGIVLDVVDGGQESDLAISAANGRTDLAVVPAGWREDTDPPYGGEAPRDRATVRQQGMTLLVDGKPFVPRAIEFNGEPLEFLAQRGFNTILLHEPPTGELAAEAHQRDLWIICTPPRPDTLVRAGLNDEASDRVLAWYMGRHVATRELDYIRRWAELVRQHDVVSSRPVIVAPEIDLLPLSKATDVLLVHHPLGSNVSGVDYAQWFDERPRLVRPGTPFWALLDSQIGDATRQQATLLAGEEAIAAGLDDGRLDELVRAASTHGCRGFVFQSTSPLNAVDAVTRRRAAVLELVNRQLQLIDPWLATGKVLGQATTTDGSATAVVLQVERARLLVPLGSLASAKQPNTSPAARSAGRAIIVPGVPESNRASLLSLAGLRPLPSKRIAGGVSVALEPQDDGLVLLTEDPQVESGLRKSLDRSGRRAVLLQKELAVAKAATVMATGLRLEQLGYEKADDQESIKRASAQVGLCDKLLASGQVEPAYQAVVLARRILDEVAQHQRSQVGNADGMISSPLAVSYDTLVQQVELMKSLGSPARQDNLLYGGDFEDLSQLVGFGWKHVALAVPDVDTRTELVAAHPYHGRYCLQLSAEAKSRRGAVPIIAEAPVWITSPPLPVTAGQVLEITGWVRVPAPIVGGAKGLQVVDSLGGQELALHVGETDEWRPFRLLRAASQTGQMTLTFALDGLGTAWVDAVMVRAVDKGTLRRLPPTSTAQPNTAVRTTPALFPSTGR
jgi:hypothetical protein